MTLSLYLLRHGETTLSQADSFCGSLDPDLTPAGYEMAAAFATAYRHLPWRAVYCSPMRRTVATATPLCEALGLTPERREGLKEIHYGEWEGLTKQLVSRQFANDYLSWMTEPAWNPPTAGETAVAVANRATPVISDIQAKYSEGNVLVVSHKATIRIILCSLLGIDLGRFRDRIDMPVASVSIIKFDRYGPKLERLGDRAHLSAALQGRTGT